MSALVESIEERVDPMVGVAVAVAAVSTSAILVEWSSAPSVVKAFYRVLFMTGAVAPFALRRSGEFRGLARRDLLLAAVSGLALAAHFATWFESLRWTTVAASVTLVTTQPVFVAVGAALLLEERLTPRMVGGIALALLGAAVMTLGPIAASALVTGGIRAALDALGAAFVGSERLYGDALALAGGVLAAVYVLAGRSLRQRLTLFTYTFVVYGVCALALGAMAIGTGAPLLGYPLAEWGLFLAMALLPGTVGHTVINWALKHVESSVVSVSLLGEPVGSTILALVLLGEVPGAVTVGGGCVVLLGIFVTSRTRVS